MVGIWVSEPTIRHSPRHSDAFSAQCCTVLSRVRLFSAQCSAIFCAFNAFFSAVEHCVGYGSGVAWPAPPLAPASDMCTSPAGCGAAGAPSAVWGPSAPPVGCRASLSAAACVSRSVGRSGWPLRSPPAHSCRLQRCRLAWLGSDSDEAYGEDGFGKECSIGGWWHFGCTNTCFGREEKIPCAAGDGSVMPDATFNCAGCGLVFHGDCVQFSKGEKMRLRAARAAGKDIAACPACVNLVHGTWRHTRQKIPRRSSMLSWRLFPRLRCQGTQRAAPKDRERGGHGCRRAQSHSQRVSAGWAGQTRDQETANQRRTRVQDTLSVLLLKRMPGFTCFDADAVALLFAG